MLWHEASPQHFKPGRRDGCSSTAGPWVAANTSRNARLSPTPAALCGTPLTTVAACARPDRLANWHDLVLADLLAAARVPLIPLRAALEQRGHDHVGTEKPTWSPDCTHWCQSSVAMLHISRAVLHVVAAAVQSTAISMQMASPHKILQYDLRAR